MSDLRLYFRYLRMNFLAGLQYKGWPMMLVSVAITCCSDPVAVLLLFARFGSIGEWSVDRVMLVYGVALTGFGLAELFSRGFDYFPDQIRTGAFDRILLRPRGTCVQVLGMEFHLHRLSRVVAGLLLVGWSLLRQGVTWGPLQWLQFCLALLAGYLVYTGVFVLSSAIAFWTVNALDWIFIFTNGSYQVAKCPPRLLPGWLRNAFIFVVPMLAFSYYPMSALCGWGAAPIWGWLALPVGLAFLSATLLGWRVGVRHYSSTGS